MAHISACVDDLVKVAHSSGEHELETAVNSLIFGAPLRCLQLKKPRLSMIWSVSARVCVCGRGRGRGIYTDAMNAALQ